MEIDRQYYKPHYGPEETDETCLADLQKTQNMKSFLHRELCDQINIKNNLNISAIKNERKQDLVNLEKA